MENEIVIKTATIGGLSENYFFALCQENRDIRFERTVHGEIIIMPPTGGETSFRNSELTTELNLWNRRKKEGIVFDSSGGFKLPNNATRSPDAAWVTKERWSKLTAAERSKFPPLCPDFVVELASESDSITTLKEKMMEYLANGCRLGWLIAPNEEKVWIYRPDKPIETISSFKETLSGENVLPGFTLDLNILR